MARGKSKRSDAAPAAAAPSSAAEPAPASAPPAGAAAAADEPQPQGFVSARWTSVLIVLAFACGVVATLMGNAAIVGGQHLGTIHVQSAPTTPAPTASANSANSANLSPDDVIGQYLEPALQKLKARGADLELESDEVTSKGGRMIMAWQTPVYRVNIESFGRDAESKKKGVFNLQKFNAAIARRVLTYFHAVTSESAKRSGTSGQDVVTDASDANNANQIFYEWQVSGGADTLFNHSETRQMFAVAQMAADVVLQTLGQTQDFIAARDRTIGAWATVHYGCMAHLAHTHPDNLLSAVYYVKMPADAGALVLSDPRGPRPPFDTRIKIRPREGDIVIFPSWLTHHVNPTPGGDERISIAFNLAGDWATTSNIRNVFEVPVS